MRKEVARTTRRREQWLLAEERTRGGRSSSQEQPPGGRTCVGSSARLICRLPRLAQGRVFAFARSPSKLRDRVLPASAQTRRVGSRAPFRLFLQPLSVSKLATPRHRRPSHRARPAWPAQDSAPRTQRATMSSGQKSSFSACDGPYIISPSPHPRSPSTIRVPQERQDLHPAGPLQWPCPPRDPLPRDYHPNHQAPLRVRLCIPQPVSAPLRDAPPLSPSTVIPLEIWDCPGDISLDVLDVAQFSTMIFVIDIQVSPPSPFLPPPILPIRAPFLSRSEDRQNGARHGHIAAARGGSRLGRVI